MNQTITVFRGDGIGPEITDVVLDILQTAKAPLEFEIFDVGAAVYEKTGAFIPEEGLKSFEKNRILLKSPITTPIGTGFKSLNVTLRQNTICGRTSVQPKPTRRCLAVLSTSTS